MNFVFKEIFEINFCWLGILYRFFFFFQFEEHCIRQVATIIPSDLCLLKLFKKIKQ